MSAFSTVTHVHLSKTFVIGYVRFLSTLTFAANGPFGYIPQINILFCEGTYSCTALIAIHLLSNQAHKVVLNSLVVITFVAIRVLGSPVQSLRRIIQ